MSLTFDDELRNISDDEYEFYIGSKQGWYGLRSKNRYQNSERAKAVQHLILENNRVVGAINAYVTMLQEGDPENEDPKKILDTIDEIIESRFKQQTKDIGGSS